MIDTILRILAPHHCCECGKTGSLLCGSCINNIVSDSENVCLACGLPAGDTGLCVQCNVGYARAWMVGSYRSSLGEMIKTMKFNGAREGVAVAAQLLAQRLPALPDTVRIVPIPTIAPHRRLRGFDHTYLIARELARQTHLRVDRCLRRRSNTVQRGRSHRDRQRQADRAYMVEGVCDKNTIYLLLDDVVTTGASMRSAAMCLRRAGAKEVWAVALTRETLDERRAI